MHKRGRCQQQHVRVTRRSDKEQAAVNTGISNVAITLSGELFAKVGGMLIFDVLDNGFPANNNDQSSNLYPQSLWQLTNSHC